MVVNDPDQSTYYDMFFTLESDNNVGALTTEITSVWSKEYTTIDDALYGAPTRKLYMLEGWADDNILQLALITPPLGGKELGGPTLLGVATTYAVLISRKMMPVTGDVAFSMIDYIYPIK